MKITKENVKTFIASNLLWGISLILILSGWTYALWAKSWSTWSSVTASDFQNLRNDVVYLKNFTEWTLTVADDNSITISALWSCTEYNECEADPDVPWEWQFSGCIERDMGIKSSNIATDWIHYYNDGSSYYKITQCSRTNGTVKILFKQ